MFAVSMPNLATSSAFVETATKWRATALGLLSFLSSHARAVRALSIVSSVVNVFEATMNSVSSGSIPNVSSAKCVASTFETKAKRSLRSEKGFSAWYAIAGPRSEPPMPMLTMLRMGLPVWPFQLPERTLRENAAMRLRTRLTSGMTSLPSTNTGVLARFRSAVWSTGRFSVALMRSPANIAWICSFSPQARATAKRSSIVFFETRFLEKSRNKPAASTDIALARPGSAWNASRSVVLRSCLKSAAACRHAGSSVNMGIDL